MDRLFANAGGAPPVSWEFEGLGTILSLVARGIGIAAVPRLALAAGAARVAVRELPGTVPARDVYAVARASSVRRPTISAVLAALHSAAKHLPGQKPRAAGLRPAAGPGLRPERPDPVCARRPRPGAPGSCMHAISRVRVITCLLSGCSSSAS